MTFINLKKKLKNETGTLEIKFCIAFFGHDEYTFGSIFQIGCYRVDENP